MSDSDRHVFPEDYEVRDGISFPKIASGDVFSYSDGDTSENHLFNLISKAADRSLFSPEILVGIRDWPSLYHLSPRRANLLRPFSSLLTKNVLEVGAGCGAITRFLGENGSHVVAVEESAWRARIARHRTSDLTNVHVVCDRIETFASSRQFDVITVIGTLGFGAISNSDKTDPHLGMLQRVRNLLTPHGVVLLAIENKLGLKYFAGARQDHPSAFDGINDSYGQGFVATFGAAELARLLDRSGLRARTWFIPCPDYKLPTTVMSAALLNRHPELAATLLAQATLADPQRPADPTFSLEQGWSVLGRNALLGELANSFLVVAGETPEAVAPYQRLEDLAWHYSVDRHPAFAKETRFVRVDNDLLVKRRSLTIAPLPAVPLRQVLASELLRQGRNWWNELSGILNEPNWSVSQVADWARVWIDALVRECGVHALNSETFLKHVDGCHFDLAPFNMVRGAAGETHFFDQELFLTPTVELGYLIARGLRDSLLRVTSCAQPAANTPCNVNQLVIAVLAELGILVTRAEIDRYALMDARVQAWVQGRANAEVSTENAKASWSAALPQRAPADWETLVHERQALRADLEQFRRQLEQTETARIELTTKLEQAQATAGKQSDEIAQLAALRERQERRIAEIDRESQAARHMLRDSQDQTQRLGGELAALQDELARKVSEHEVERNRLVAINKAGDDRIATLGLDLQAAHARLQESEAKLRALSDDSDGKLQTLAAERDAAHDELARRVSEHEAERTRFTTLRKESADRITALGLDLQSVHRQLRDSEARLQAVTADSEAKLQALAAERDAAHDELARRVSEHEAERTRFTTLSKESADRITALGLDLQSVHRQLRDSEARFQAVTTDSEAKLKALAAERDAVHKDASQAAMERDAAARQVAQLFAEVGKLSALKLRLEAETARQQDAHARDAQIAKAHAEGLRAALLRQAQEIDALASKPSRFSPKVVVLAVARPFTRWKRADYRQKAWEADVIRKSRLFSGLSYLRRYPDVAEAGEDPLLHYICYGETEGRMAHPLFDGRYYLTRYPEAAEAAMSALAHYASAGVAAGFDPHPLFDTDWYLQQNPDVAADGVNPLHHYMTQGWRDGCDPHPEFNTSLYLAHNPDVAAGAENPLVHYVYHGQAEGRPAWPSARR